MDVNELSQAIRILDGSHSLVSMELAYALWWDGQISIDSIDLAAEIIRNSPNKGAGALAEALIEGLGL